VKFWVGVTDRDWFDFLAARQPDEVNFWQPSGGRLFRALQPGEPFLFKLHSPDNFIVGGGFFVRHAAIPISLAWESFGEKNGVSELKALRERVWKYRRREGEATTSDPVIGCSILAEPFFLPRNDWLPVPHTWAKNIVQGKTYDTAMSDGAGLWASILQRLHALQLADPADRYGAEYVARARLGQGAFRVLVTEAYGRRCAITGERTLPVLEAAHIKPYSEEGPHQVSNGLLLRSDLHTLFDRGYVTVTPDLHLEVSRRIREEFSNGRDYYAHHGRSLAVVPEAMPERPNASFLRWHNETTFLR
jgi:putative restriction endonuclease